MNTNRLINEKSPYLLQHAHNPVDWYPWGEEAFEKAKKEDKPIFLSIGYSTCHWCHVMEEESFSNEEIAEILNKHFVAIKVDREERPDLDNIYMEAVMAMTGSGGWPLNIFLTPERKPFYGGTYFPPENRWGRQGLKSVLLSIHDGWVNRRSEVLKSSEYLVGQLRSRKLSVGEKAPLDEGALREAYKYLSQQFDKNNGGFARAPKFPMAFNISFLLRFWKRAGEADALAMVEKTLKEIEKGGINDQIGGGIHRYSTDARWHIPHFEKMLYDQAILSRALLEAYQATGKKEYAEGAEDIFRYVLRDMTRAEGGFYSAEDADSIVNAKEPELKKEGAFYVWDNDELIYILGKENAQIFSYRFGVKKKGNAASDPHGEFKGKNILFKDKSIEETAGQFHKKEMEIEEILNDSIEKLFSVREKRPRPYLDDKILVDWNGLMISSLAFGGRVLGEEKYIEAAKKASDFILSELVDEKGQLLHRWRDGEAGIPGMVDDYAFFINGLIDLYEATFDIKYLEKADEFMDLMLDLFWDEQGGGFFFTSDSAEELIIRPKATYDGAIPSGNALAVLDMIRLSKFTMDRELDKKIDILFKSSSEMVKMSPTGFLQLLIGLDFYLGPSKEIVIAGSGDDAIEDEMVDIIFEKFIPNKIVVFNPLEKDRAESVSELVPFIEQQKALDGQSTVYVCENYACKLPVTGIDELKQTLGD